MDDDNINDEIIETDDNELATDGDFNGGENPDDAAYETMNDFIEIPEISIEEIVQTKISKKIRDLQEFLTSGNMTTEKGDQRTNLINVSEKKTYCLPDSKIEEFFNILDDCRKEERMLHYSERQETQTQSHSGIMIDFDRYQKSKESQITDRHLGTLVTRISKILYESLDMQEHPDPKGLLAYYVFIIKKPSVVLQPQKRPEDAPIYKDGFHILIPEIQVTKGFK
jgi:hypothetical protein